ncbi:MAG: carbohydrate ABC transporter permease [Candidatus Bipolaricaulia bacterium]
MAQSTGRLDSLSPTQRRRSWMPTWLRDFLSRAPLHLTIFVIAFIWLIPTIGLFVTSFREPGAATTTGWWTVFANPLDANFTLQNYQETLFEHEMFDAFLNSLIITIPATLIPLFAAILASYALSWMDFRGRFVITLVIVGLIVVPLQTTFIPLLQAFGDLGLQANKGPIYGYMRLWIAHSGYGLPLLVYMSRNFVAALPRELFESAYIDGASHWTAFRKLVIPLSVPVIASLSIFQFLWVWNDLIVALIFLGGGAKTQPVTLVIAQLSGSFGQDWQLLTSAAFISMVIPLAVFFALQRYFVRGILAGSLKG